MRDYTGNSAGMLALDAALFKNGVLRTGRSLTHDEIVCLQAASRHIAEVLAQAGQNRSAAA